MGFSGLQNIKTDYKKLLKNIKEETDQTAPAETPKKRETCWTVFTPNFIYQDPAWMLLPCIYQWLMLKGQLTYYSRYALILLSLLWY